MNNLFNDYELKYSDYSSVMEDDIPRSLRVFNIRFRLAIDIIVDFNGNVSLTKTPIVKSTYARLIKLLEKWNSFEAFIHYLKEYSDYCKNNETPYKSIYSNILDTSGTKAILVKHIDIIKKEYDTNESFKKDLDIYFQRLLNEEKIKKGLTENCLKFYKYLTGDILKINGYELLGLIYAEGNMYYHNGETVKFGMKYQNRAKIIDYYSSSIEEFLLVLAGYILSIETLNNQ